MNPHVHGLDHVMVLCRDLDAALDTWARLGFTVSPRGEHSGAMGTANHTITFRRDYVEIIGVLRETEHNAMTRAFLSRRGDGMERVAFLTSDAAAGLAALRARGIGGIGPTAFERTRTLPGEEPRTARFRGFWWPIEEAPGDLRLRACQHLTPDLVWQPSLIDHPNTATRIRRLELLAENPEAACVRMAELLGAGAEPITDGAWRMSTGDGRADFEFLGHAALERRHPVLRAEALPREGVVAMAVAVADMDTAAKSIGVAFVRSPLAIAIVPALANGLLLLFEPDGQ